MNQNNADRFNTKPLTDAEIQGVNVGKAQELNSQIVLEEYSENWPLEYERQKSLIAQALGNLEYSVEHVGSTAIPGMTAKPILDVVLEVPDSSREADYVPQLESNGFKLKIREPDWFEHRLLKGLTFQVNLHVFTRGCSEVDRMTKFRDHLKTDQTDFSLYLAKKRELATKIWKFTQNYADAKTEVVKDIFSRIK